MLRGCEAVRCVVACCHQPILSLHVVTLSLLPLPSHPILKHVLETRLVKKCVPALPISRSPLTLSPEAKDIRDNAVLSRSVTPIPASRPTTPRPPGSAEQHAHLRSGMLTIRIFSGASPSYHNSHPRSPTSQAAVSLWRLACRSQKSSKKRSTHRQHQDDPPATVRACNGSATGGFPTSSSSSTTTRSSWTPWAVISQIQYGTTAPHCTPCYSGPSGTD